MSLKKTKHLRYAAVGLRDTGGQGSQCSQRKLRNMLESHNYHSKRNQKTEVDASLQVWGESLIHA